MFELGALIVANRLDAGAFPVANTNLKAAACTGGLQSSKLLSRNPPHNLARLGLHVRG